MRCRQLTILHPPLQSLVCVLRVRRRPLGHLSGSSSSITMDQTSDSTSSHPPDMLAPKLSQKRRRTSDADEHPMHPAVYLLSHKTWKSPSLRLGSRETPPPEIENLTIHSPSPQAFDTNRGESASPAESWEDSGRDDSDRGGRRGDSDGRLSSSDQESEVAFFALRDQSGQDGGGSSFYNVHDIAFLDNDHLGVILSSSPSRASGTISTALTNPSADTNTSTSSAGGIASGGVDHHEDQFLISILLQSPDCPYQDLSSYLSEMSLSSIESLESNSSPCLLEKLAAVIETEYTQKRKDGTEAVGSSPRLTMYPLPTSRVRQIRYMAGPRIASNEREMKRLLSVHGLCPLTPENSLQTMSKRLQRIGTHISVFEH